MRRLLYVRIVIAALFFTGFCLLFLESFGTPLIAKWQIGPALLAGNIAALVSLGIVTLVFGRIYCAMFCPLGISQDLLSRLKRRRKYRFLPALNAARYAILAVFLLGIGVGLPLLFSFLDPYSIFGRILVDFFSPVWNFAHNTVAWGSRQLESYAIVGTVDRPREWVAIVVSGLSLLALLVVAWRWGRVLCNLCPVGTLLGMISRFSLFRIRINTDACTVCGKCARVCKTGCIDPANGIVDDSRCVACFNCLQTCSGSALAYAASGPDKAAPSLSRRSLLMLLPVAFAAPASAAMLPPGRHDKPPARKGRALRGRTVLAPGAVSASHFIGNCSGCQLCVSACPTGILATFDNGLSLLQPSLTFEYGFCLPGCTRCGAACPTGAISNFTAQKKERLQIGIADVDFERCIVHTEGIPCKACYNICPPQVIRLEQISGIPAILQRPVVDQQHCIGCGACEYVCPARPIAAIKVNGLARQIEI